MFSRTFGYALRAATHVACYGVQGEKVGLQELAVALRLPRPFLGKIMQGLVRHGVVGSIKGPNGGFFANEHTAEVTLQKILLITDGELVFTECALGIQHCNAETPCPLHTEYMVCRSGLLQALSEKTLGMLAEEVRTGRSFLVR